MQELMRTLMGNQIKVKIISIDQFYHLYFMLKETIPVMKLLAEKHHPTPTRLEKIASFSDTCITKAESPSDREKEEGEMDFESEKKQESEDKKEEGGEVINLQNIASYLMEGDNDSECTICMFERIQIMLPCTHSFCEECIDSWLKKDQGCPICRQSARQSLKFAVQSKMKKDN
jgi:hypothetical protein